MVRAAVEALVGSVCSQTAKPKMNVQFFAKKKQFKVFVTIDDCKLAQKFFQAIWSMKELPIPDPSNYTTVLFNREMRAYLVKSEAEF